jgi:hypothetical protein
MGGGLMVVKQVGGGEETVASQSRVRGDGEEVLGGAVLGVGSRWSEDGWSGLSVVARFSRKGTAAVEWRSSRGHRQGGPGSSRRWCGDRGGDRRFRGGLGGISQ